MIVTNLMRADTANRRAPRKVGNDVALVRKRIERNAMVRRPTILRRARKDRLFVGNIGVFERELPDSEPAKRIDIAPYRRGAVYVAARHHAGGPNGQAAGGVEELSQRRRRRPHQMPIQRFIEMMPRIAKIGQAGVRKRIRESARQEAAVREAGDLFEKKRAPANDIENRIGA